MDRSHSFVLLAAKLEFASKSISSLKLQTLPMSDNCVVIEPAALFVRLERMVVRTRSDRLVP